MPLAIRIDDRLVHGQVVMAWVPTMHLEAVVVVDDDFSSVVPWRRIVTPLMPPGVVFEAVPMAHAREAAERHSNERSILLVRDVSRAVQLIERLGGRHQITLGNSHAAHDRTPLTAAVHLSLDELDALQGLADEGEAVRLQTLPSDRPLDLGELRRRYSLAHPD
jgi:mannose/fructose/N-acetylgalactosamine-specific phosphotransferase system component IIB